MTEPGPPPEPPTDHDGPRDQELVAAARAGDRAALELLLERFEPRIYRFGMKMCRHPEDAEDILQETLVAMARSVGDFRGASSLSTWLWTIARSFCLKKRRRSKFAPAREESLEDPATSGAVRAVADPGRGPDQEVADRELRDALEAAIDRLDPMYREVLVLRDVEGLTAPEVATVLDLSIEAVKSRLHRARLAVRAEVAPLFAAPSAETAPGGTCPDVLLLWSRNLEGEVNPELCAELERHVAACARCRAACDSLKHTLALCRTTAAPAVPPSIQEAVRRAIRELTAT
jgi:RNA polymerase sigma-70 factor (ECF subfamily)